MIGEGDFVDVRGERMRVTATSRNRATGIVSIQFERGPQGRS